MSSRNSPHTEFDFAPKPGMLDAGSISAAVFHWAKEVMPFNLGCGVFSPEQALKKKKANCFGQALGAVALLESWGIPSGIVLGNQPVLHAAVLVPVPEPKVKLDRLVAVEPARYCGVEFRNMEDQVSFLGNGVYQKQVARYLIHDAFEALASEDCCINFRIDRTSRKRGWQIDPSSSIRTGATIVGNDPAFIVTDAQKGREMLMSTGKLMGYRYGGNENSRTAYIERYYDLIQFVPDFISLPEPKS